MEVFEHNKKEDILKYLKKSIEKRTEEEIRIISRYFSENYQYFIKLKSNKDFGLQRIERIIKYAKLETHLPDEIIINYGELGDKFYILLEGSVALYKPIYYEEYLTPIEFSDILIKIRDVDLDYNKYERLIEKNNHLPFKIRDIEGMQGIKPNYMFYKVKIFIEKLEKIGVFGEGFSFGEMALIKKTTRNATIKAIKKSYLLTIDKKDYNRAIKGLQDENLSNRIEKFVGSYPLFKMLYKDKILELFNNFQKKVIYKGEYLFKQNDESDKFYFLNKGTINLNFNISFSWIKEYLDYINNYSGNLLFYVIGKKPEKYSDLVDIFKKAKNETNNHFYIDKIKDSKIKVEENIRYEKWEECNEKINKDNLIGLKVEEDKLNSPNKVFNVKLKNVNPFIIIGLEDAIEYRKRIFSAQCVSEHAELDFIKIFDFIKIICTLSDKDLYNFLHYILNKKTILKTQIINKIKYLEKKIIFSLNNKYDNLKGDENNIKTEEDKNRIISVLRLKGFKTKIQELLDKDYTLYKSPNSRNEIFKENKIKFNSTKKKLIERNKKELLILKRINKLSFSNPHILKFKNNKEFFENTHSNLSKNIFKNIYSYSYRNKQNLNKIRSFYSYTKNFNSNSSLKDYIINSFLSKSKNKDNSKDKKSLSKIIPKFNLNKNLSKEKKISLQNKILSLYSPLKEASSTFIDSSDRKNIYPIILSEKNKSPYKLTKNIKYSKFLLSDSSGEKKIDEIKKDTILKDKKKEESDDERLYYEKLGKNTKQFILEKKFNLKFRHELIKIKPSHYQNFYNK